MVAACTFVALIVTGARNAFGIFVIPMTEEFQWSRGMISFAAALGFLVNGATQPFLGRLVDRTGGRSAILISLVVVGSIHHPAQPSPSISSFSMFMFGLVTSTAASGASITNTGASSRQVVPAEARHRGRPYRGGSLGRRPYPGAVLHVPASSLG